MAQLQLRSHSVGDIIDASFTVYRKRFGPMIAIALMLVFIPFVVGVIGGCTITELQTSCDTAIGWIGQIASQIGMVIAAAAAMLVAAEAYVGTSSDWRNSAAAGLRRIIPIVVATVVVTVAVAIGFVLVLVPGIFLAVSGLAEYLDEMVRFQGFLGVVVGLGWWGWVGEVVFPVEVDVFVDDRRENVRGGAWRSWFLFR